MPFGPFATRNVRRRDAGQPHGLDCWNSGVRYRPAQNWTVRTSIAITNNEVERTMGRRFQNILETVGHTPVVRINRRGPAGVNLYVKVEAFNPLGSVKDRLVL